MKIVRQLPFAILLSAVGLLAQPAPNSVQNPGSNFIVGMPNYGIAQGSVFVVYGTGLGPSTILGAPSLPLGTTLGGTSITVTVNGTTVNALMNYTYATQVAAILPSSTPVGTGTLTVTYNPGSGALSGSTPITVVASNFGLLSQNQTGTGPAVATHVDNSVVSATNTTYPGEEIVIWGTGLGPLPTGVSDAAAPGASGENIGGITIWVGGVQVPSTSMQYHGRNPSDPGLDQINFTIPAGVSGCNVSIVVQTGSTVSNTATLAVGSSRSTCSDANGLSYSTLNQFLNSNGTVRVGGLTLSQSQYSYSFGGETLNETSVSASGSFEKYTAAQLTSATGVFSLPSIGSCTIVVEYPNSSSTPTINATGLDAGTPIVLNGPVTANLAEQTTAAGKGSYSTPYTGSSGALTSLPAGSYTFTGPGGADVGAFLAKLTVPVNFTWTNEPSLNAPIDRSTGLLLTWTGGDPTSYVIIIGESINPSADSILGAIFYCIAPVAPGKFTIPSTVLLSLAATSTSADNPGTGVLELGTTTATQPFTASGLDVAYANASSYSGVSVLWQ